MKSFTQSRESVSKLIVCVTMLIATAFGTSHTLGVQKTALSDNWQFFFAGNDSSLAFAQENAVHPEERVRVPHTFPLKSKGPVAGFGWYFRELKYSPSIVDKDVFLDFNGIALRAQVFVDGVFAGKNDFAYTPFSVPLTPLLQGKTRVCIAIRVDNRLLPGQIPDPNAKGWWIYGGLIREVYLSIRSPQRIDLAQVRTLYADSNTFGLHLKLLPSKFMWDSVTVSLSPLCSPRPHYTATVFGTDTLIRIHGIDPWTPESPQQYTLSLVPYFSGTPGDTLTVVRGLCQLTAKNSTLYLNGKPYFLRGMSRHDVLADKGPLLTRKDRLRDLLDLKALGVNFLRIAHFPQHADIYELCDSLGFLVMDEIPAWKTDSRFLGSKEGRDFGSDYMKNLITAHGNYTCICLWSLGNQFASFKTSVADYVGNVAATVKAADSSRLVTFCSFYYIWDKAFSHVDVISVNEYFGWELASLTMLGPMLDNIHRDWPGKPVLVSELGAQAQKGFRNPHPKLAGFVTSVLTKDISEDHQALFIQSHLDTIWGKRAYVGGVVIWSYADYMTNQNKARREPMPIGLNACGIVTADRQEKLSYGIVKECYGAFRKLFIETLYEKP